jgi:hypothetical protein
MSEEPQKQESHAGRWAAWTAAALLIYVLSCGPVNAWYVRHFSYPAHDGLQVLYAPVILLQSNQSVAPYFEDYEDWWDWHVPGLPHMVPYLFQWWRPASHSSMSGTGVLYLTMPISSAPSGTPESKEANSGKGKP